MTVVTTSLVLEGSNGEVPFDITTVKQLSDLNNVQVQVVLDNGAQTFNIPATYTATQFANTLDSSIVAYQNKQNPGPQISLLNLLTSNPINMLAANGYDVSNLTFQPAQVTPPAS